MGPMSQTRHKPRKARPHDRAHSGIPTVSAALIVKNEAEIITRCLDSVRPLVDEIVVYDTGSTDDTVTICRAAGARVFEGYWDDDFSRARNAALAECRGDWVLSIDADETVAGKRGDLRSALSNAQSAKVGLLIVEQTILEPGGHTGYDVPQQRLFRRRGAAWTGRVHEQPTVLAGLRGAQLDASVMKLTHYGYSVSKDQLAAKSERNLQLALADVSDRVEDDEEYPLAKALLDLGRSLMGVKRWADAFTAFSDVRDLADKTGWLWAEATSCLARIAVRTGNHLAAIDLADELSQVHPQLTGYAHYLATEALMGAGQVEAARELISTVDEVVDATGRRYDPELVHAYKVRIGAVPA